MVFKMQTIDQCAVPLLEKLSLTLIFEGIIKIHKVLALYDHI